MLLVERREPLDPRPFEVVRELVREARPFELVRFRDAFVFDEPFRLVDRLDLERERAELPLEDLVVCAI